MSYVLSRRALFRSTVGAGATATLVRGATPPGPAAAAGATPFLPYSASSYFKSRVEAASVDAIRTTVFRNFMATHADQRGLAYPLVKGVGGNRWGTVWAVGTETDPLWKFTGITPNARNRILFEQGFHAPEWLGEALTGTSDSPFGVRDEASGFTVFGTKATMAGPHLIASTAGRRASPGTPPTVSTPATPSPTMTATSPAAAGSRTAWSSPARPWTLRSPIALASATCCTCFWPRRGPPTGYCHPMTGPETGKFGFGAEGERIRIKPSIDLTTRGLSPFGLAIARTLQQHGAYIGDNAGRATSLKAEQASGGRDPWAGLDVSTDALKGITWADFEVVQRGG